MHYNYKFGELKELLVHHIAIMIELQVDANMHMNQMWAFDRHET